MDKIIAGILIVYLHVSLNRETSIGKIALFILIFLEYKFNTSINCFSFVKQNPKEFVKADNYYTVILSYIAFFQFIEYKFLEKCFHRNTES